jgi:nucleoside-diphosphate-sugar epimerase
MVLASTVKVYGEATRRGAPFRAGDPPRPSGAYARSKAEAEAVLWQAGREHGIEGVALRLPLVYGPEVKGNFLALLDAVGAGRRLPLARIANHRSLLYVGNAVTAFEAALHAPALVGEALPVADAESPSTPELIERVAKAIGVPARLSALPPSLLRMGAALAGRGGAAGRLLGSLEVDATRFRELAGWTPATTLDAGLAATGVWWRRAHQR